MRAALQLDVSTPESAWAGCAELAPFDLTYIERAVVIAPHPDDEVLALGGVMQLLARRGCELSIVAVTDGEASHPRARHLTKSQLAELHAREREVALGRLGFGCRDGDVARETGLGDWLEPLVANATHCFAPWELDGHPDHDATGRAAAIACMRTETELVRYPVWAWHWATPGELPWADARRIDLDAAAVAAKHDAIAAYHSQIARLDGAPVVLAPDMLARFHRGFEVVFVASGA